MLPRPPTLIEVTQRELDQTFLAMERYIAEHQQQTPPTSPGMDVDEPALGGGVNVNTNVNK